MQFTVKHLLIATTLVAVGSYALVFATPWWGTLIFSATVLFLACAILCACFARERDRAMAIGCATFGWGYLALICGPFPLLTADYEPWRLTDGPDFISTVALRDLYFKVLPYVHIEPEFDNSGKLINKSRYPSENEYMQVGHSLAAVFFALLGGWLAGQIYDRYRKTRPQQLPAG